MAVLQTDAIEERSEHFFGFEKFTRNLARRSRMTAIISVNFAHRFGDFSELAKTEESTLLAVDLAETGLLRDYRTSGGKIAGAAIAEPSGVQSNVLILGDGELGFRSANVIAVVPVIDAQVVRGAKAPTGLRKLYSRLLVFNICGQFKDLPGYSWRINETRELTRFAPQIIDCRLDTLVAFYLFDTWISLDIVNAIARQKIVVEFLLATEIHNCIGRFIELTNFS